MVQFRCLNADAVLPTDGVFRLSGPAVELAPGARALLSTGLQSVFPATHVLNIAALAVYEQCTYTFPGVVDAGYDKEVKVLMFNRSDKPISLESGQPIGRFYVKALSQKATVHVDGKRNAEHDAGYDVFSPCETVVPAHGTAEIELVDPVTVLDGYAVFESRSGMAFKHGVTLLRTNVRTGRNFVSLFNHSDEPYEVHAGDKFCQMVCYEQAQVPIEIVSIAFQEVARTPDTFNEMRSAMFSLIFYPVLDRTVTETEEVVTTDRGDGFGSSGR